MEFIGERGADGKPAGTLKTEDFVFDETDVTNYGIQKLITKDILVALEPMLVGEQFLKIDTKLVGTAGRIRTIRKEAASSDAQDFNAGADVPTVSTEKVPSTVDITPTKFGHSEVVYEDAIDAMDIDAIVQTENSLAAGMARRSDARIWNEIFNATVVTDEAVHTTTGTNKRYAFANDLVLSITALTLDAGAQTLGTHYYFDFFTGRMEFVTLPAAAQDIVASYIYTDRTNVIEASSVGRLQRNDLIDAKTKIRTANYGKADLCAVNENDISDLEKDKQYSDASQYGNNSVLMNGEIGKTSNLTILVSEKMYQGVAFVAHSGERLGTLAFKKKTVVRAVEMEAKSGDILVKMWQKSKPGVVGQLYGCIILNIHQYAKSITSNYV
jgi:N4-gp56 family major capsid protein